MDRLITERRLDNRKQCDHGQGSEHLWQKRDCQSLQCKLEILFEERKCVGDITGMVLQFLLDGRGDLISFRKAFLRGEAVEQERRGDTCEGRADYQSEGSRRVVDSRTLGSSIA